MGTRTEAQKLARKVREEELASEYGKFYASNPNHVQECRRCSKPKPLRDFMSTYAFRTLCKECHRGQVSDWRDLNPEAAKEIKRKSFWRSAQNIRSKKDEACTACKRRFPFYVLDFHHVGEKSTNIAKLYEKSQERLERELSQCILICANCHRDETFTEKNSIPTFKNRVHPEDVVEIQTSSESIVRTCASCNTRKDEKNFTPLKTGYRHSYCKRCLREKNRTYGKSREKESRSETAIREFKDNKKCTDCGRQFRYWMLDMDHIDEKTANLNTMRKRSLDLIMEEMTKCEIVCVNCHRERTWKRRLGGRQVKEAPFSLKDLTVRRGTIEDAKSFLDLHHYAGYGRPAVTVYFIRSSGPGTVAVAKVSPTIRVESGRRLGMRQHEILELDRFCIAPEFQFKNVASRSLSLVVKAIRQDYREVKVLISFADTDHDHEGGIYRASNWVHDGMAAASHRYESNGKEIHKKTVYNRAAASGQTEKEYAVSRGLTKVPTPGKHRFLYWMDRTGTGTM